MRTRRVQSWTAAIGLLLILAPAASAADTGWWNNAWSCRRQIDVPKFDPAANSVCAVTFPTGGRCRPDGRDIRVISNWEVLPHKITSMGPGDVCRVAFQLKRGERFCHIYYGNPDAPAPETEWTPTAGLVLETRACDKAPCESYEQMLEAARSSEPVLGADFVDQAFHGYNPFGPSENYLSIYHGRLRCAQSGEYEFAISSAGPAYLVIDKKVVVQRPQWGGPAWRAYFRGKVALKAGPHSFAFYTAFRTGRPTAVVAWVPPGAKDPRFVAVPPSAFGGVVEAKLAAYHCRGEDLAADFSWENAGETQVGDSLLLRMIFTDQSTPSPALAAKVRWSFGDGTTAEGGKVEHAYLEPGTYAVQLSVEQEGKRYAVTNRVRVDKAWALQTTRQEEPLDRYALLARGYLLDKLSLPQLAVAVQLFHETASWKQSAAAGRLLLRRDDWKALRPEQVAATLLTLGGDYRSGVNDLDGALALYRLGEKTAAAPALKSKFVLEIGDTYFYSYHDAVKARAEYQRLLRQYEGADAYVTRQTYLRLGDTQAAGGGYDEALRYYRKAESLPIGYAGPRKEVAIGSRALESEDYLRRGEFDAAGESLNAWQWEHPTEKLRGQWSLLMARWAVAKGDYGEAIKLLRTLVGVNPRSEFVPQALLLLAQCLEVKKRVPEAIEALQKLKDDYPESPERETALKQLETLTRKPQ